MPWTRPLLLAKRRALLIHLGISALLFVPFALLLLCRWFPPPLFFTDGGWQGLRLMLAIDMVLGPALTFLVFNPAKSVRELTLDLGLIGLVQASALGFGAWSVARERIEAVAFADGSFHAVPHSQFAQQTVTPGSWARFGERAPYWVYAREPRAGAEAGGVMAFQFTLGLKRHELQFLYEPLAGQREPLAAAALDGAKLAAYGGRVRARYEELVGEHSGRTLLAIPLVGYYRTAILVFDDRLELLEVLYPPEGAKPAR